PKGYGRAKAAQQRSRMIQQMQVREQVRREVAAQCGVAMSAVPANSGDLDRTLIELHVVGLMRIGCGIDAGDGNVDRRIDRDVEVDETSRKRAIAAVTGAVAACCNDIRADQTQERGKAADVTANRGVAVSAIAADAGHLKRGLIERHIV